MSQVAVRKVDVGGPSLPERIREKAFHLFEQRGRAEGSALDDWLKAEQEFLSHGSEFVEKQDAFEIHLPAEGFDPAEVHVSVTSGEVTVEAEHSQKQERKEGDVQISETSENSLFRFFALPSPIDVDKVTAKLSNGVLKLTAAKAA